MELKELNYMGLSDCSSSVDSSGFSAASEESRNLNLKSTELRLGLPGSQSPERKEDAGFISSSKLDEKLLFPLHPLTRPSSNLGVKSVPMKDRPGTQPPKHKDVMTLRTVASETKAKDTIAATNNSAPATKAQVVGWPPIRSFRKNSLSTTSKNTGKDEKVGTGALFVKVSMDGAPYLRKVDLKVYTAYQDLSSGLEKMFSCFTIGQCAPHGANGREVLSESKLKDLLHGSEYILTYEDKDGDWMLVGDVPWKMFIVSCKRLRIRKGADAIGLAPRAMEKSRNRN